MTTNPKRPRKYFKSTQLRELRLLRYFLERIHSGEWYSGNSLMKEGKTVRKLSSEECCSNLLFTACWLGGLTDKFWINTEFEDWYLTLLHLVPAREKRESSGVLRSHCLSALQDLVGRNGLLLLLLSQFKQVLSLNCPYFNNCEWLNIMFVVMT